MDFNDSDAIRTMDTNSVLTNTFFRMFLGLLASAVTAIYTYYSGMYIDIVTSGAFYGLAIAEVVVSNSSYYYVFRICIFEWIYFVCYFRSL